METGIAHGLSQWLMLEWPLETAEEIQKGANGL